MVLVLHPLSLKHFLVVLIVSVIGYYISIHSYGLYIIPFISTFLFSRPIVFSSDINDGSPDAFRSVDPEYKFVTEILYWIVQPRQSVFLTLERFCTHYPSFPYISVINYSIRNFKDNFP